MSHVVAVLSLLALLVVPADLARAQPKTAIQSSGSLLDRMPARKAAPVRLSSKRMLSRINARLKAAGLKVLGSAPQTLAVRVTPVKPKDAAGGAVTFMGPGVWQAPESGHPDGSFLAQNASVRMELATTPNKLYVLDCRMEMIHGASVRVQRPGAPDTTLPVEDGHLVHAFMAKESTSKVVLRYTPPPDFPAAGYWYGCDFGAAN